MVRSCFFNPSATLSLSIGDFSSLTFGVLIDTLGFPIATSLSFFLLLCLYCFLPLVFLCTMSLWYFIIIFYISSFLCSVHQFSIFVLWLPLSLCKRKISFVHTIVLFILIAFYQHSSVQFQSVSLSLFRLFFWSQIISFYAVHSFLNCLLLKMLLFL